MVVKFTPQGQVLAEWNVLREDPWFRFSRDVDYRKVDSTKPHQSHPYAFFQLGEEVWVIRHFQKDAICLTSPGKRINIDVEKLRRLGPARPHSFHDRGRKNREKAGCWSSAK
ncbi:MAG: hypothetical protein WA604_05490 [Candidatus Sulfotelmatobacter sp.]